MTPRILCSVLMLGAALTVAGCGDDDDDPPAFPPGITATGDADPIRLDILNGTSAAAVSLQVTENQLYQFPSSAGRTYTLTVDTTPSGENILLTITEFVPGSGLVRYNQPVRTPVALPIPVSVDGLMRVEVFDPWQNNLTLSTISVVPDSRPFDSTSFDVLFHICGDDFTGLGYQNDLATTGDKVTFAADLVTAANVLLAPTGAQIRVATAGLSELSNATVISADPSLVQAGNTLAPDTSAQVLAYASLGAPASDPNFGRHADVFITHSPSPTGALGACACGLQSQGGTFVGSGGNGTLYIPLFDDMGNPRAEAVIQETLAHELGHFLGLEHPTEQDFTVDDIPDTPFSDAATYDIDPTNGQLDASSLLENMGPDSTNVMFWLRVPPITQDQWTTQQGEAIRGLLGTRDH